jgi:AcrR family transcriptional regulator
MGGEPVILSRSMLVSAIGDRWPAEEIEQAAELLAKGGGRFPSGLRTLPGQLIREIQRERLLAGMLQAAADLGYGATTVQDALDRSAISRPAFYEHFANKEDCFLVAVDAGVRRVGQRLQTAAREGGESWRRRLRLALAELLRFVAAEPDAARALIVEVRTAGATALRRRDELLDELAKRLASEAGGGLPDPPSPIEAAGVVGGIEAVLYARISRGETELMPLLPSLMYFAVLPYAGQRAAEEELEQAVPA